VSGVPEGRRRTTSRYGRESQSLENPFSEARQHLKLHWMLKEDLHIRVEWASGERDTCIMFQHYNYGH
jgi:hypothetical protein